MKAQSILRDCRPKLAGDDSAYLKELESWQCNVPIADAPAMPFKAIVAELGKTNCSSCKKTRCQIGRPSEPQVLDRETRCVVHNDVSESRRLRDMRQPCRKPTVRVVWPVRVEHTRDRSSRARPYSKHPPLELFMDSAGNLKSVHRVFLRHRKSRIEQHAITDIGIV